MIKNFLQTACVFIILTGIMTVHANAQNVSPMSENTSEKVVTEVSIYKFKPGINEEEALEATSSVNDFLKSRDGFISRRSSKTPDGQWVDVILWESMDQVKAASAQAMQTPVCLAFFEKTVESSTVFLLAEEQFSIKKE